MKYDAKVSVEREMKVKPYLLCMGWVRVGNWRYKSPSGSIHDLSAADIKQLNRIEHEGLFLVTY